MKLLILASGKGKRLRGKTKSNPKCLVKVKGRPIIEYMVEKFTIFKEVIIVGGYKCHMLKKYESKNCKVFFNKDYSKTNMVHSLFSAKRKIRTDIIVSYSDIIYSRKILEKMKKHNSTHIPINKNWFKFWKKRMKINEIYNDAENLEISKKKIKSIGSKIKDKMPKFQFMGLVRINYNDYTKLKKFYFKLKNYNIDMTSFLNLAIKYKILNLKYFTTSEFWVEIDSLKDLRAVNKII